MTNLIFYEYDGFELPDGTITESLAASGLHHHQVQYIDQLSRIHGSTIFKITRSTIRAQQFLGTIQVAGTTIEVRPKLCRSRNESGAGGHLLRNIFNMLSYVNQIDGLDFGCFDLAQYEFRFIEVYMTVYARRLLRLLQTSPPSRYVDTRADLRFVRGRIDISEAARRNLLGREIVPCAYDEFSSDNVLMQAFKYVATCLLKTSSEAGTRKLLSQSLAILDGVSLKRIALDDVKYVQIPRKSSHLLAVFSLAKMFLRHLSSDIYGGSANSIALLINMNELFEKFVVCLMQQNKSRLGIKQLFAQKGRRLVNGVRGFGEASFESKMLFGTIQDIVVDFYSGKRLVIDTKYKILAPDDVDAKRVTNSDIYQVLAYRELNAGTVDPVVLLLYPQYKEKIGCEYRVASMRDVRFGVATLDMGVDLRQGVGMVIDQLVGIFTGLNLL